MVETIQLNMQIRTNRRIGSMSAGTLGTVIRRNSKSLTIKTTNGGIATVPFGSFDIVEG